MKTFAVLLPMLSLAMIGYSGQTNQIDLHQTTAAPQPPPSVPNSGVVIHRTNSVQHLFHVEKSYGGVLPDLRNKRTEFFRPSPAPRSREFQNVSINPITGRAEGLILFSINF